MSFRSVIGVVSMGLFLGGCFGGCPGGGGGGGGGPIPVDELGSEVAAVICGAYEQCFGPGLVGEGCQEQFAMQFEDSTLVQWQEAIDRGTLDYDGRRMRDCLDAMDAAGCDAFEEESQPEACEEALAGTVEPTGSCFIDEECAGDAFCNDWESCPGSCESYLTANADCSTTGECDPSLTCFDGTCVPRAGENQPCGGGLHPYCAGNLECENEDFETPGTCVRRPAPTQVGLDQVCDPEAGTFCQSGLSCALTEFGETGVTWTCVAAVGSGAACNFGVPDPCPDTEYCMGEPAPGNLEGVCTTLPGEDQTCADSWFSEGCQPGLMCNDLGTCVAPKRLTEACADDGECVSDTCDEAASVCVAPDC